MRVLLIEDSPQEILIVKKALKPFTSDIAVADNGDTAVVMFRASFDENTPFDLVLLDLMLPGIDGHEVLLKIRQEEQRRTMGFDSTNVIILTGLDENFESLQFAASAGVLDYLRKPINTANLHRTLKSFGFQPMSQESGA